jgi:hypothetical protein
MSDVMERTVSIKGLDPHSTREEVRDILNRAAKVEKVFLRVSSQGKPNGTAFASLQSKHLIQSLSEYFAEDPHIEICQMSSPEVSEFENVMRECEADVLFEKLCNITSPRDKQRMMSKLETMGVKSVEKTRVSSDLKFHNVPKSHVTHSPFVLQGPKLPMFSGEKSKDTSFGRWKYEVKCLFRNRSMSEEIIISAVHQSLKGTAADVITRMGEDVTAEDILNKFESIYGTVMTGEAILERFYSAKQGTDENCAQWSCRLEELAYQALEKETVTQDEVAAMLRSRFWSGLRDSRLKDALRQSKSSMTVEELVREARSLEQEFGLSDVQEAKAPKVHSQQTPDPNKGIMDKLSELLNRMNKLEEEVNRSKAPTQNAYQQQTASQQQVFQHQSTQGNGQISTAPGSQAGGTRCFACNHEGHVAQGCRQGTNIQCFKCKELGHVSRGCRKHLNYQ